MKRNAVVHSLVSVMALRILTRFSREEILQIVSEHPEWSAMSPCGGEVDDHAPMTREFLTCNIRRLESLKRNAEMQLKNGDGQRPVTVRCWTHQVEFVLKFFEGVPCHILHVPLEAFEKHVGLDIKK